MTLLPLNEHEKYVRLCVTLPVRLLRRQSQTLHLRARVGDQIPEVHLRFATRPDGYPH
jgi:hypothetical protein